MTKKYNMRWWVNIYWSLSIWIRRGNLLFSNRCGYWHVDLTLLWIERSLCFHFWLIFLNSMRIWMTRNWIRDRCSQSSICMKSMYMFSGLPSLFSFIFHRGSPWTCRILAILFVGEGAMFIKGRIRLLELTL